MSAAYRCKLRHWLMSMLVLHLFVLTFAGFQWFARALPDLPLSSENSSIWIWPINQSIEVYILLFALLWLWHLGDFIQRGESRNHALKLAASYRLPLGLLCFHDAAAFFNQSSFLNDLGCPERFPDPEFLILDGCGSWTPWWKELLATIPLIGLLVASLVKLVLAIGSRFRRLPKTGVIS
ncbi:hypothetical protein [Erythrobacter alti]|uniref:hypothetical protein n=1 Tax=Erythrobacter alti TaxID=1896145 RepID=UPI0030F3DC3B